MNSEATHVAQQRTLDSHWTQVETHSPLTSIPGARADGESGVRRVVEAVGRRISLNEPMLPEEFFPAHLSVAIVEAVSRFRLGPHAPSPQAALRYCRRFGLTHKRRNIFELPPADEQETVADLIAHYDELGVDGMANEVFETSHLLPGTTICGAETALRAAQALRSIGVDVLQDVQDQSTQEFEEALCSVPGTDRSMARLLMTYAGDDDFVVADNPVRRFVAEAAGHATVSASWTAHVVRQAAYEIVLSPRHLDHLIYRYRAGSRRG